MPSKKLQDNKDTRTARVNIGFPRQKQDWKKLPAIYSNNKLSIYNQPVIEEWERPYMRTLAKIATSHNGVIIEVGFGMGIAAEYIDEADVYKHIIIEANHSVAERAREFACNAKNRTYILEGFWQEVIDQILDDSIDGILCDTYPLSAKELHKDNWKFFPVAFKKLKSGGVFTYYSDEAKDYSKAQRQALLNAGFANENIFSKIVDVNPPSKCLYWQAKTFLAPIVIK
ncbi:MAG: class I SAM-dependent methyltransferase [Patescibacteria group bacterium]